MGAGSVALQLIGGILAFENVRITLQGGPRPETEQVARMLMLRPGRRGGRRTRTDGRSSRLWSDWLEEERSGETRLSPPNYATLLRGQVQERLLTFSSANLATMSTRPIPRFAESRFQFRILFSQFGFFDQNIPSHFFFFFNCPPLPLVPLTHTHTTTRQGSQARRGKRRRIGLLSLNADHHSSEPHTLNPTHTLATILYV